MIQEAIKVNLTRTDLIQCGWRECTAFLNEKIGYKQGGWVFNEDSNAHGPYRMFKTKIGISTSTDVVYEIFENRWSKDLKKEDSFKIGETYKEGFMGIPEPKMSFLYNGEIRTREELLQIMVDLDICTQEYMDYKLEHNFDIGEHVIVLELLGVIDAIKITRDKKFYDIAIPGMLNGEDSYAMLYNIDEQLVTRSQ